jgi:N-acetylmuramic acid 6-phosphate etherase
MDTLAAELNRLKTEKQNVASTDLDSMSALELATLMNREDAKVAEAVRKVLPEVARAIEVTAERLGQGGRLIYVGAGTSGRIGALDASECPPTFNTPPKMVQFMMAGGPKALAAATEASEDSTALGRADMRKKKPGKRDVVVGLAASGRTPYTIAAIEYARKQGAATIAVVCNDGSPLAKAAEIGIEAVVGPEVLTGSTRLKAGTAEKMICNMLTTGAMARLGYVYGNLMVNMHLKNKKLIERGLTILQKTADVDRDRGLAALKAADMKLPEAIVMLRAGVSKPEANRRLRKANGRVREAISG